jgi:hypothetical protein
MDEIFVNRRAVSCITIELKAFSRERREILAYRVLEISALTNCADSGVAESACVGAAVPSGCGLAFGIEPCGAADGRSIVRENLSQKKTLLADGLSRSVALNISTSSVALRWHEDRRDAPANHTAGNHVRWIMKTEHQSQFRMMPMAMIEKATACMV